MPHPSDCEGREFLGIPGSPLICSAAVLTFDVFTLLEICTRRRATEKEHTELFDFCDSFVRTGFPASGFVVQRINLAPPNQISIPGVGGWCSIARICCLVPLVTTLCIIIHITTFDKSIRTCGVVEPCLN